LSYCNFERALIKQGKHEKVIKTFKEALRVKPEDALLYHNLGISLNCIKKYADAIVYFKKAININPDCASTYNAMGFAFK
jgi:tetratricopeptide (TPR) repeat protein